MRDFLTEDVERVVVDNEQAYERMRAMISRISAGGLLKSARTRSSFIRSTSPSSTA